MKPTYEQLEQQVLEQAVQLANAESKCRDLAAENACLKQSIEEVAEAFETGTDGVLATAVDESLNLLTPETDAVLKRIQAQGVDAAIEHLNKKFAGTGHIGVPVMALEWLAQELRKGGTA